MNDAQFPPDFLNSISNSRGFDRENFIATHLSEEAPTSIRLNPLKKTPAQYSHQVPWCEWGYYLDSRPSFTFDPLFQAGCYYVQEASSMFIGHILKQIKPDENIKVLDLCAAPGGKSTLISSLLDSGDLLVANEIIKTRVPVLGDNLTKWGPANAIVTNNDPKDFGRLKGFFDIIVVDAPCSGSGMFRKDRDAMSEWSEANVNLCQQRQERILADVYPALKEDGYLIYSTCSYSVEENEQILDWLCDEFELESIRIPIEPAWDIVESRSEKHKAWGYRFYPGKVKGEGLFAACLRKRENTGEMPTTKYKEQQKANFKEIDLVKPYVKDADQYYYFKVGDDWLAIDRTHREDLGILQQHLYIKKSGVRVGKLAGKDLIPDHELALSLIINKEAFLQTELTKEQAIQYLRRDNITGLDIHAKGWSLMNYEGQTLGWAKLLPNRINNYFPKEMRIFSQATNVMLLMFAVLAMMTSCHSKGGKLKDSKENYVVSNARNTLPITALPFGCEILITNKFPKQWDVKTTDGFTPRKPINPDQVELEKVRKFFDKLNSSKSTIAPKVKGITYLNINSDSVLVRDLKKIKFDFKYRLADFGPYQCYYQYHEFPIEHAYEADSGKKYLEVGDLLFVEPKTGNARAINVFNSYTFSEPVGGYNRYFYIGTDKKIQIFEAGEEEESSFLKRTQEIVVQENGMISVKNLE